MSPEFVIFLTGLSVAISACTLGTYLNISRQSLLGDALSHSLLPGLVIAHLATGDLDPKALFLGALLSGLATGYIIEFIGTRFRVREDISMGITFTAAFSLGVVLLVKYASKSHLDTDCLLFGNLLFVPLEDGFFKTGLFSHIPQTLTQSSLIAILSLLFIFFLHRPFMNLLFHENSFKLAGLSGHLLKSIFLSLVSLTIVFGFQAMGALLVFGLFVIPVCIGRIFNKSFIGICIVALSSAILSLATSIKASFVYDLNPSAAWVSLMFVMFIFLFVASKLKIKSKKVLGSLCLVLTPLLSANEISTFDRIWATPTIYSNKENPWIQELQIIGRYHGQFHEATSHNSSSNDWEDRRARLGIDSLLFHEKIEIKIEAQSSDTFSPLYNGLVDAYLRLNINDDLRITAGKQRTQLAAFDFLFSSNLFPAFERSQIFNQLRVDRTTSIVTEASPNNWQLQAGVYSNDSDQEFGQFAAGYAYGFGLGYDFKEFTNLKKALLRYDFLYSDIRKNSTLLNRYEFMHSLTFWIEEAKWRLVSEVFLASIEDLQVFGFYILPSYEIINETLEIVSRYSYSTGNQNNSLSPQSRYERELNTNRGEEYHSLYGGLQYFIYGDKLKVMSAIEYATLKGTDLNSWTFLLGSRLHF